MLFNTAETPRCRIGVLILSRYGWQIAFPKDYSLKKKSCFFFFFRERGREEEREGEKHQCVVTSCAPLLGTWPTIQACALTGNQTLVYRPAPEDYSYVFVSSFLACITLFTVATH